MNFYGVHDELYEGVARRIDLFRQACELRDVNYIDVDARIFDYTSVPNLEKYDLLYTLSLGANRLTSLLLNDRVTTFYKKTPPTNIATSTLNWTVLHEKAGLLGPRTVFSLTSDRHMLSLYIEHLGGFPVVIKMEDSTRGIGTIKIESWHSLYSTMDYLCQIRASGVMRQFINAKYGVRAIVLGNEIAAAFRFLPQDNDFRNAPILAQTRYEPIGLTSVERELCVSSVASIGLEMGGVDFLVDQGGAAWLLEVNFPTGLQSLPIGEDIEVVGSMIDFLIEKASR
jgi:glutathione synthase/RimK-type ligase-like ATP-grasp enzyme